MTAKYGIKKIKKEDNMFSFFVSLYQKIITWQDS